MLQEPQEWIAKDIVVLVVDAPGRDDVAKVNFVAGEWRPEVGTLAVFGDQPVSLSHGAGYPGKLRELCQGVEGGDDTAAASASLGAPLLGHLMLYRTPVAGQYQVTLGEYRVT
jgi:hypothetical protein